MSNASCWLTGLRSGQSENRNNIAEFLWEEKFGIIKYNPLYNWSTDKIINYLRTNNVPYNKLHDKGFISIGCEPCTRAVKNGEGIRSGRWWWEDSSKKECGINFDPKRKY